MRTPPKILTGVIIGIFLGSFLSHLSNLSCEESLATIALKEDGAVYDDWKEEEQSKEKYPKVQQENLCNKRYLLLTTQKSGSTWFCSVLHQQNGISCGGRPSRYNTPSSELLIKYSIMSRRGNIQNVTWPKFQADLDDAFAEVCEFNPATSIGFKVMYDQIPPQFIRNGNFEKYLKDNQVQIIHLVREAKILVLASKYDAIERGGVHHTTNSSMLKETSSLKWDEESIGIMLEKEKSSLDWQNNIHNMTPFVQNFYVAYENLLVEEKRKQLLGQTAVFIAGSFDPDIEKTEGALLKQSESSCSSRIAKYEEFRAHKKVINSRTASACDLIDRNSKN
eukprot:CAMPEP_0116014484 /NCGR_PEP_ID=MMETSP0321-20121206/6297_1 /TAXON_ID=163516 /ORGANISM="Leptocylindrus danicus var. danicus, Strain B650" /LENGTH=335 /DNA_ID=CAMNT_0003484129 /DNA_START=224 /DNA_END=1228 /DNA_ORIENTATION=-